MPGIKVVHFSKHFGKVKAVDDVSFDVKDGEFVALLGPSGCGKTTTLLTLAGIYKPTKGEIYFGDELVNNVPPKYRNIGMVFQNYALYPHMNVFENIAFPLRNKKTPEDEIKKRVFEVAKKLMIDKILDRKPSQISGGQQQRVALARALIKQPQILLFDEPLSNLDAKLRLMMRAEIKKLQEDLGITSVYVTHDQSEAMTMASRIAVFTHGKLVQYDTPDVIYNKPKNMFVASFIGNPPMNLLEGFSLERKEGSFVAKRKSLKFTLSKEISKILENKKELPKEVVLGFRPEDVLLFANEKDDNLFEGEIYVLEPLGRDLIVNIRIPKEDIIIKVLTYNNVILNPGEKIKLSIKPEKFHLFDPITEFSLIYGGG